MRVFKNSFLPHPPAPYPVNEEGEQNDFKAPPSLAGRAAEGVGWGKNETIDHFKHPYVVPLSFNSIISSGRFHNGRQWTRNVTKPPGQRVRRRRLRHSPQRIRERPPSFPTSS